MTDNRTPLGLLAVAHYGKALKEADRDGRGSHPVYGSNGEVGRHTEGLVANPTIVIGRKGSVGEVTYAPQGGWPIDTAYYLELLDPERVDLRYLYWALRYARLDQRAITTSIPGLNRDELYRTWVFEPPVDEQRRIAWMLDKADAVLSKQRERLRLLDEFLQSAFLEMFGNPVKNQHGWEVGRVGDVISETQYGTSARANSQGNGLIVLRMNNITRAGWIDLREVKWCEIGARDIDRYTLRRGDLLFNRTNSPELVGKTAVWDLDEPYAFAGYLVRVRFDQTRALPEYVSGYLNSSYGKQMLFEKAKPSINMSNISPTELKRLPIMLPPLDTQLRYRKLLAKVKVAAQAISAALPVYESLYASLAQHAFEGNPRDIAFRDVTLGLPDAVRG
jgi:type I restriction enzyme, S subunit